MNKVKKIDARYICFSSYKFRINQEHEKIFRSKSNISKNYDEHVYFKGMNEGKNKSEIDEEQIRKAIRESLNKKYIDVGNEYIDKDPNSQNKLAENQGELIEGKFLEKLRGSTVKVNLNISNNYYNSNYNLYQDVKEKTQKNENNKIKEISKAKSKASMEYNEEGKTPNRFTVFLKKIFFANESNSHTNPVECSVIPNKDLKKKHKVVPSMKNVELLYIPCQNCNSMIKLEEIDSHSEYCVKVKLEVYQSEIENKFEAVNYKLKKLRENLLKIKLNPNFEKNKESYYIHTLIQTISDSLKLETENMETIQKLNKLALNLQTLLFKFKGSISIQVLLERAKILVREKLEEFKISFNFKKQTDSSLDDRSKFKERLTELKKAKEEKIQEVNRLTVQKQHLQNKIKNFKNSRGLGENNLGRQGTYLKPRNFHILKAHLNSEIGLKNNQDNYDQEYHPQQRISNWADPKFNLHNVIDNIDSDVEDTSQIAYNTDLSSVYSSNKNEINDTTLNLTICENPPPSELSPRNSKMLQTKPDAKEIKNLYREFVKSVLKIKFELFNGSHPAQKISEKILFNECMTKEIPKHKYREFILNELNQPQKYLKCFKNPSNVIKTKINHKPMEIINEESFN